MFDWKRLKTKSGKSAVREQIERIHGVCQTWFEWDVEDGRLVGTLVVEVYLDIDPNSPDWQRGIQDAIVEAAGTGAHEEAAAAVNRLRIVPRVR